MAAAAAVVVTHARTHLSAETAKESEPYVTERERDVLVEKVPEELAHPVVRPSAVDQQQPLQEPELSQRIVGRQRRLVTLLPGNAHPNVRLLDHRHVVGAVADGQRHGFLVLFDQLHHHGLLKGSHPAAYHRLA